jgi:hypothetical protein
MFHLSKGSGPGLTRLAFAVTVNDAEGVYFIPVMAGLGAPHGMLAHEQLAHAGSLVTTAAVQVDERVEPRDEKHPLPGVS